MGKEKLRRVEGGKNTEAKKQVGEGRDKLRLEEEEKQRAGTEVIQNSSPSIPDQSWEP